MLKVKGLPLLDKVGRAIIKCKLDIVIKDEICKYILHGLNALVCQGDAKYDPFHM